MYKSSLRNVLIYPYVILISMLAIAIGTLSYFSGSHAVLTVSEHLLKETVGRIGQAVDRHIVGSAVTLETAFPTGVYAPKSIKQEFETLRTRFWIATSLHIDPNNYVYYGNNTGQAIGLYRHSYEMGELRVKFQENEHRKKYRITGIDGQLQFDSIEKKLFDPRKRPWYLAGLNTDKDIWTSVYIDFGTEELVATRARRVLDENGQTNGVVATDMPLKALNEFVSELDVSPSGIAFILEPNGDLIASSCSPNVKQGEEGKKVRINAADSGHTLLTEIYNHIKPLLDENEQMDVIINFIFEDSDGREIHAAFERFKDSIGLRWINVVAMPSEDFMGGIRGNVFRTLFLGIFATCIVVAIGLWTLHWFTTDLKRLSDAVKQIRSGDVEEVIDIRRHDEIGDLAKNFQAMKYRLQTDHLTGLPNRYAFEQALNASIQRFHRKKSSSSFAILFIDINDFKKINDMFGHDGGDQALIEFGLRLRTNVRPNDLVARYAGDEFVILINNLKCKDDLMPIQKNIEIVLSEPLKSFANAQLNAGAAIGEAYFPDDADNAKELLIIADQNMYTHKAESKK